jgi:hypothetical protein
MNVRETVSHKDLDRYCWRSADMARDIARQLDRDEPGGAWGNLAAAKECSPSTTLSATLALLQARNRWSAVVELCDEIEADLRRHEAAKARRSALNRHRWAGLSPPNARSQTLADLDGR